MSRIAFWLAVLACTAALSAPAQADSFTYSLDDGTRESEAGIDIGGDLIWLNEFTVTPPFSLITSISVVFGRVANGTPVTVALWRDPNGDGNPIDAILLATGAGTVANATTNIFNTYDIPDTDVGAGRFFVGAFIVHPAGEFPAAFDSTSPAGRSWAIAAVAGTTNLADLSASFLYPPANWMVRANAASVVPEPMTLVLVGAGLAALAARRRRR